MTLFNSRCPSCHKMNRIPDVKISSNPTCGHCKSALLDGFPIEGTPQNLPALLKSDLPVVIDFWAPWCSPCIGFTPIFKQVSTEYQGRVRFVKIDTEANQQLAAQYQIRSIPTIMVYKKGIRVDVINGALPQREFEQWLSQAICK